MTRLFDQRQVAKLAGISESQVRYWDRVGLIPHVERQKGKKLFDFQAADYIFSYRFVVNISKYTKYIPYVFVGDRISIV